MKLYIPSKPPILDCIDVTWHKWFAFWSLPLDAKADLVDEYPELVIERPTRPETIASGGPPVKIYFEPGVFDTQVQNEDIFKFWDSIELGHEYPKQDFPNITWGIDHRNKWELFNKLNTLNYAVLAYKYRYDIRPEAHYFEMNYHQALVTATTFNELLSFYHDPARKT